MRDKAAGPRQDITVVDKRVKGIGSSPSSTSGTSASGEGGRGGGNVRRFSGADDRYGGVVDEMARRSGQWGAGETLGTGAERQAEVAGTAT